jgi:hypothetical protein
MDDMSYFIYGFHCHSLVNWLMFFWCRYHMFNANRQTESVVPGVPEDEIYARPVDVRMPRVRWQLFFFKIKSIESL